ncbi:glycosyltransferase involved in cell wall biosynthesis [Novosphingobium hassiacum]|uniref:Glycosyltransferase involved in cell wall biosynthesis n=1 Tax=Novosphingobium hassiacum TaxID=173676 RepID=A0A7W6A1Y7_9SPHN|nr:glycosyltransferase involved in cell wall biosynthesis [Novosphingobium hassiacum]
MTASLARVIAGVDRNDAGASLVAKRSIASDARPSLLFFLPGLTAGGSEHVVTFNANRLAAKGYRVHIVSCEAQGSTPYYPCDEAVRIHYLGVPVSQRGKLRELFAILGRVRALRRMLIQLEPDLVISFLTRTNVIAVAAAQGLGLPVIVSERNNPQRQRPGPVWRALRRITYARAFGLVTMTRGAMAYFPKAMRRRGWVIPNMADWQHYKPSKASAQPRLTAVGRLTGQKGFDLLIEAFAATAPDHPDWRLSIWGEGADRAALEQQARALGMADRIDLPGVSKSPGSWIETADAFVLSSRFEGWGLVLGEAMAAGLPCVSFDCPFGPSDMITHGVDGLLVPDGDVSALAAALSQVMGDPALRDRLGASATNAAERFAPERIGARWEAMINQVLHTNADRSQSPC